MGEFIRLTMLSNPERQERKKKRKHLSKDKKHNYRDSSGPFECGLCFHILPKTQFSKRQQAQKKTKNCRNCITGFLEIHY
mgnify:CR=1 FL=1